ncbi:MAG: phytanoyl-CoA dioxygenase family protein [Granulosicoccus sp.]
MNLTADQLSDYHANGFVMIENAVPKPLLEEMQQITHNLIDQSRHISQNNSVYDLDSEHNVNNPRLNRIKTPHKVHDVFRRYMHSDDLLDLIKPILGDSIRLHNSKLNTKAAQGGSAVHWHQDWAFYPHTNDSLLAVGVMLSDISLHDGPLQCIPGSHRGPVIEHSADGVFCGAVDPADPMVQLDKAETLTGKAGAVSLHHVRTLHGSAPNNGADPRLLLLYEFSASDAWPIAGAQSSLANLSADELWQQMQDNLVCGEQSLAPRLCDVPIRMPLPLPDDASSIFQVQASGGARSAF